MERIMHPLSFYLTIAATALRERWRALRTQPERGNTAETVALIALLVVLALGVVAIISVKVTGAANGISLP
jgi:heme A synthase